MVPTIGAELEFSVRRGIGGPLVDTIRECRIEWRSPEYEFEALTPDAAFCSGEAITKKCMTPGGIESSLMRCIAALPKGLVPDYVTKTPYDGDIPFAHKPRYIVMPDAFQKEHPNGRKGMHKLARGNATQYHIGTFDVRTRVAILLLNILNNSSTYARSEVIRRLHIEGADQHLEMWLDWLREERMPAPRWFANTEEMISLVESVPMFLIETPDGPQIGDGRLSRFEDKMTMGYFWWLVRPRPLYGSLEWRPFPSMAPNKVALLADYILKLVRAFLGYVDRHPAVLGAGRYSDEIAKLYRFLAEISFLIPIKPVSDEVWWKLYHR